jgi:hypothetical protein
MLQCHMHATPDGRERSATVTPVPFPEPFAGPALPLTTQEIVPPVFQAGDLACDPRMAGLAGQLATVLPGRKAPRSIPLPLATRSQS